MKRGANVFWIRCPCLRILTSHQSFIAHAHPCNINRFPAWQLYLHPLFAEHHRRSVAYLQRWLQQLFSTWIFVGLNSCRMKTWRMDLIGQSLETGYLHPSVQVWQGHITTTSAPAISSTFELPASHSEKYFKVKDNGWQATKSEMSQLYILILSKYQFLSSQSAPTSCSSCTLKSLSARPVIQWVAIIKC